jgi:hypothetical protein
MADFLTAIALAIALEGALYAIFPSAMKKFMAKALGEPDNTLRGAGMLAVVIGIICIWLIRL